MAYISPPPHHDIYSIEDLAQLIADLRAVNPTARIGVKLVASRGIGTIAAGVVKSGADYVHVAGHAGGTGASPLSSIKHAGVPWELGLAEVHQVLLRAGLRDRAVLRTDGGLRTGRDIVIAALLGAEEFALGTAVLVALGCDMARQCHLDTCPTGIATQREDLRAKFAGTPGAGRAVRRRPGRRRPSRAGRDRRPIAGRDRRRSLAILKPAPGRCPSIAAALIRAPRWPASAERRANPSAAAAASPAVPASAVELELLRSARRLRAGADGLGRPDDGRSCLRRAPLAGAHARHEVDGPVHLVARGAAGQSFGAFLTAGLTLELEGVANDYVAKGLSGGVVIVRPEADLAGIAASQSIAGNTCLYGATGGRLHLVGRAGMRFAVRNSGAEAVVEGIGPHGCEYMTGGVVVVLGPIGPNFGAGMTGGRAYLLDPRGHHAARVDAGSVSATRLADAVQGRDDAHLLAAELRRLLVAHAAVGSALAEALLAGRRTGAARHLDRRTDRGRGNRIATFPHPGRRRHGGRRPRSVRLGRMPPTRRDAAEPARTQPWTPRSRSTAPDTAAAPGSADRSPAPPVVAAWRRLPQGGYAHFGAMGGRDARGCRVECVDAVHDTSGRVDLLIVA